jgi:hypothetical protein
MLALGGGGEADDTNIDTDRCSGRFERPGRHLVTGQDQHPAAPLAANLDGLDPTLDLAVDGDLHLSDPLQIHPAAVGPPPAAVTVGGPLNAIEPVGSLEPRVAGCLASLHPTEEPGERSVQPAQRRLLGRERPYRHVRPDLPDLSELGRLVPIGDTGSPQPPRIPSFLQGGVVQLAVRRQALPQGDVLASGGTQPKLVGPPHTAPHYRLLRQRATAQKRTSALTVRSYTADTTSTAVSPQPTAHLPTSPTSNNTTPLGAM